MNKRKIRNVRQNRNQKEVGRLPFRLSLFEKGSKGYIYSLEVLIAISIILVAMVFLFRYAPTKPEIEISILKQQGFDILEYMNNEGTLREYVFNNNETELEAYLAVLLPKNIYFETDICSVSCERTNVPNNETVISIDYYVSGYKEHYIGKKVRLWIWRKY